MSPRRSQPKRGGKHTFAVPGDLVDPDSFSAVASDWLEWLRAHNYAHVTMVGAAGSTFRGERLRPTAG